MDFGLRLTGVLPTLFFVFAILVIVSAISIIMINIKASDIKKELVKNNEVNKKILERLNERDK